MLLAPRNCTEGNRACQKAKPEEREPSLAGEWQVRAESSHQTPADGGRDQRLDGLQPSPSHLRHLRLLVLVHPESRTGSSARFRRLHP